MINLEEFRSKKIEEYSKESSDTLIAQLCDIHHQIGVMLTQSSWSNTTKFDIRSAVIIEILKERLNN